LHPGGICGFCDHQAPVACGSAVAWADWVGACGLVVGWGARAYRVPSWR
jgi:hypothetical protein